jgi:hypothetical protein
VSIVCEIVACPSISWTLLGLTFLDKSNVAHVCRKEAISKSTANSVYG